MNTKQRERWRNCEVLAGFSKREVFDVKMIV